jgi:hypothetical protein
VNNTTNIKDSIEQPEKQAGIQLPVDLRDYFAAKAMQGLISEPSLQGTVDEFAHRAYVIADAMMGARKA